MTIESTPLRELITVIRNGLNTGQYDEPVDDEMLPISRIETISEGTVDFARVKYSRVSESERRKYQLQSGDILFSHINSPAHIGKTAIFRSGQALIHGVNLLLLRPNPECCYPEYLNYYLKSFDVRAWFRARCKKAVNQASLNQSDVKSIEVPLPPLPEQKRIAAILAKADRLRRLRRYARELSDTYLQSVFLEMFGDSERFVPLDSVARIDRTPASSEDCRVLPYVGLEHIEKDKGHFVAEFEGNPENLLASKYRFTSEHVLYGKLRPYLNKVALPTFDGVCTTEILPILPLEGKLDRAYLWAFLKSPKFVEWASSSVSGANLPRLAPKLLAKYNIPLPPFALQQEFAYIVRKFERLRAQQREAERQAEHLFQTLLHRAFLYERLGFAVIGETETHYPMRWPPESE